LSCAPVSCGLKYEVELCTSQLWVKVWSWIVHQSVVG